jgi:hypothetical protein
MEISFSHIEKSQCVTWPGSGLERAHPTSASAISGPESGYLEDFLHTGNLAYWGQSFSAWGELFGVLLLILMVVQAQMHIEDTKCNILVPEVR